MDDTVAGSDVTVGGTGEVTVIVSSVMTVDSVEEVTIDCSVTTGDSVEVEVV